MVSTSGGSHVTAVDVGTSVVAADGVDAGAGRVLDTDDEAGDFAFTWQPGARRRDPPAGSIVHVYRHGAGAIVVATDDLDSYNRSCTKGNDKTCTLTLAGSNAGRWWVALDSGGVMPLLGNPTIAIDTFDAGGHPQPDTYAATIGTPDDLTQAVADLVAGLIDLL